MVEYVWIEIPISKELPPEGEFIPMLLENTEFSPIIVVRHGEEYNDYYADDDGGASRDVSKSVTHWLKRVPITEIINIF